jgi:hypothetical protein
MLGAILAPLISSYFNQSQAPAAPKKTSDEQPTEVKASPPKSSAKPPLEDNDPHPPAVTQVAPDESDAPVDLPALKKPEEPDWEIRTAYWGNYFDKRVKDPAIGESIEISLPRGPSRKGEIVELFADSVTLRQEQGIEITLERSQLSEKSKHRLWPKDYRDVYVTRKIDAERRQYAGQFAAAYDTLIRQLRPLANRLGAELKTELSSQGVMLAGKVSQVIGSDILLYRKGYDEPVYVEGVGSGLVDGSAWSGEVYAAGATRYSTVLGVAKTVRKFTIYPQGDASQLMAKLLYVESRIGDLTHEKGLAVAKYR